MHARNTNTTVNLEKIEPIDFPPNIYNKLNNIKNSPKIKEPSIKSASLNKKASKSDIKDERLIKARKQVMMQKINFELDTIKGFGPRLSRKSSALISKITNTETCSDNKTPNEFNDNNKPIPKHRRVVSDFILPSSEHQQKNKQLYKNIINTLGTMKTKNESESFQDTQRRRQSVNDQELSSNISANETKTPIISNTILPC